MMRYVVYLICCGGIIAIFSYLDLYVDISVIVFLWSFSRYAYLSCSPSSFQYYDITGISPRIETYQGITPQVGCCSTERSSCKFSILFPHFITCILDKTVLTLIGILPTNSLQLKPRCLSLKLNRKLNCRKGWWRVNLVGLQVLRILYWRRILKVEWEQRGVVYVT